MSSVKFAAVVAVTRDWGIGRDALLPWHPKRLHLDLGFLKYITTHDYQLIEDGRVQLEEGRGKNAVIMGRKTWDSIPARFRPMEDRYNVVITSQVQALKETMGDLATDNVHVVGSFDEAIEQGAQLTAHTGGRIFVLGGSSVYAAALEDARCDMVFITRLVKHPEMPCNVFFPGSMLQEKFKPTANLNKEVLQLLSYSLPKSAVVNLEEDGKSVAEQGISYSIEAWQPK